MRSPQSGEEGRAWSGGMEGAWAVYWSVSVSLSFVHSSFILFSPAATGVLLGQRRGSHVLVIPLSRSLPFLPIHCVLYLTGSPPEFLPFVQTWRADEWQSDKSDLSNRFKGLFPETLSSSFLSLSLKCQGSNSDLEWPQAGVKPSALLHRMNLFCGDSLA